MHTESDFKTPAVPYDTKALVKELMLIKGVSDYNMATAISAVAILGRTPGIPTPILILPEFTDKITVIWRDYDKYIKAVITDKGCEGGLLPLPPTTVTSEHMTALKSTPLPAVFKDASELGIWVVANYFHQNRCTVLNRSSSTDRSQAVNTHREYKFTLTFQYKILNNPTIRAKVRKYFDERLDCIDVSMNSLDCPEKSDPLKVHQLVDNLDISVKYRMQVGFAKPFEQWIPGLIDLITDFAYYTGRTFYTTEYD